MFLAHLTVQKGYSQQIGVVPSSYLRIQVPSILWLCSLVWLPRSLCFSSSSQRKGKRWGGERQGGLVEHFYGSGKEISIYISDSTVKNLVTCNCKRDWEMQPYLCAQKAGNQLAVFAKTDEMGCCPGWSMDFCSKLSKLRLLDLHISRNLCKLLGVLK